MITVKGYCPVCEISGRRVELILNKSDFFECPVCGIQIGLSCRPMALLMHESGDGEFAEPVVFASPYFHSYNLAPETEDMNPCSSAAEIFESKYDLVRYVQKNDLYCTDLPVVRIPNVFFSKMISMAIEDKRNDDFEISVLENFMRESPLKQTLSVDYFFTEYLSTENLYRISIYRKDIRRTMGIMRYKVIVITEKGEITYAADIDEYTGRMEEMKSCINH